MKYQNIIGSGNRSLARPPTDQNKWQHILCLYNQLILIEYSPITALNSNFCFCQSLRIEEAHFRSRKTEFA